MSDINTAMVDSLKVLDPKWPIREADIISFCSGAYGYRMDPKNREAVKHALSHKPSSIHQR